MAKNKQPKNLKDQKAPTDAAARRAAVAASQNKDAAKESVSKALPARFGIKGGSVKVTRTTKNKEDGSVKKVKAVVTAGAKRKPVADVRVGKPKKIKPAPAPMPGRPATSEELKKIADRKAAAKDRASRDIAGNLRGTGDPIEDVKADMTRSQRAASVIAAEKGRSHKYAATPVADSNGGVSPRWQILGYESAQHMLHHPVDGRFPEVKAGAKAKGPKISHEDWVAKHDARLATLGAKEAPAATAAPATDTDYESPSARRRAAASKARGEAAAAGRDQATGDAPSTQVDSREALRAAAKAALIKADPLGLRK